MSVGSKPYLVVLPSDIGDINRVGVTCACGPRRATLNVIFRQFRGISNGRGKARAIVRGLNQDSGHYAFEVPEISSHARLSQYDIEYSQEGFLADEMAGRFGGNERDYLDLIRSALSRDSR